VFQIHLEDEDGDVLVFLTGQEEIEAMERLVRERAARLPEGSRKVLVAPIYSAMPADQQMRVFQPAPAGARKVSESFQGLRSADRG
jgi:ATP-dependent RNA helicase DHX8/PRP22